MSFDAERQKAEIEGICRRTGLSLDDLALKAAVKPETMRKISKGYQPASEQLMQTFKLIEELQSTYSGSILSEVSVGARMTGKAPVISWASAGVGGNYSDVEGFLDEYLETDCRDPNCYGLIVEGDSMEPLFRAGDRIIVAPNEGARNGDIVVARVAKTGEVYFKLFHQIGRDGKAVRLTSYNPAYPPLEFELSQFRFIQPVYSSTRKLRQSRK